MFNFDYSYLSLPQKFYSLTQPHLNYSPKVFLLNKQICNKFKLKIKTKDTLIDLIFTNKISNNAYQQRKDRINIQMKSGEIKDITEASDQFNINVLTKTVNKYFLCFPKINN